MVQNFSKNVKMRMNNMTKQILAFNPQKMDMATAQKTKRVISDGLAESEKILKL
jgi:hypothetical protein